jgi:hypothetical protein
MLLLSGYRLPKITFSFVNIRYLILTPPFQVRDEQKHFWFKESFLVQGRRSRIHPVSVYSPISQEGIRYVRSRERADPSPSALERVQSYTKGLSVKGGEHSRMLNCVGIARRQDRCAPSSINLH